jgi:polyhydroxyalkanoate synthesis regulator phasin
MGLWKIAIGILVGAALTESGRKTIKSLSKQLIEAGQITMDKGSATIDDLKIKTTKLIEEIKSEQKSGTNGTTKE